MPLTYDRLVVASRHLTIRAYQVVQHGAHAVDRLAELDARPPECTRVAEHGASADTGRQPTADAAAPTSAAAITWRLPTGVATNTDGAPSGTAIACIAATTNASMIADARCSSAIDSRPSCHRSPISRRSDTTD